MVARLFYTDRHYKAKSCFVHFSNVPKKRETATQWMQRFNKYTEEGLHDTGKASSDLHTWNLDTVYIGHI